MSPEVRTSRFGLFVLTVELFEYKQEIINGWEMKLYERKVRSGVVDIGGRIDEEKCRTSINLGKIHTVCIV